MPIVVFPEPVGPARSVALPVQKPPASIAIEPGNARRSTADVSLVGGRLDRADETRIHLQARRGDVEGVKPLPVGAAAELEHAQVPLVARPEGVPRQLDDPVRHRELGKHRDVLVPVLSDQKDGRVVRREEPGDLVQHQPHLLGRRRQVVDRLEGVDHDDLRRHRLDRVLEPGKQRADALRRQLGAERLVLDGAAHLVHVEEPELLEVLDHLVERLGERREVEDRPPLVVRVGEDELLGEGRLARSRLAHDDVDRVLGDSASEDLVELAVAGREAPIGIRA